MPECLTESQAGALRLKVSEWHGVLADLRGLVRPLDPDVRFQLDAIELTKHGPVLEA